MKVIQMLLCEVKRPRIHTLCKIRDDTELILGLKRVQHLYNILVTQATQDFNLLPQADNILFTLVALQYELHSHCLACVLSASLVDLCTVMCIHIFIDSVMW